MRLRYGRDPKRFPSLVKAQSRKGVNMKDNNDEHRSLDYMRSVVMNHLEYNKVYTTHDIVQMMNETGLIPNLQAQQTSLLLAPLFHYGFLKIVGWQRLCKSHYYEFVKLHDFHSVEVRIRWMPNHYDVWIWERLVDGVIIEQKLNTF